MKKFNFLILFGLFINVLVFTASYLTDTFILNDNDIYYYLSKNERFITLVFSKACISFGISIFLQLISLFILSKSSKAGLIVAIVGTIPMIPFSFIFLIGYLYSYQNRVNRHFTVFSQQHVDISLTFKISQLIMIGVLYFIFGALVAIIAPGIGMIVAALGIISICNALFLKNKILLGVSQANLIITPSIFSHSYLIPLNAITLVTENDYMFKVRVKYMSIERDYTFRKGLIKQKEAQKILDSIFSKLKSETK